MKNYDAILILTNQCNLKCAYCIYACDITEAKYFITIEELNNTLQLMKNKLFSLKRIILSGGDPFMHPLFIQICERIRVFFPTIELCAYTNGLTLKKFNDQEIIYLTKQLNLSIISSLYPSENNLKEYKKQDKRFKSLNTKLFYQSSHFYFTKKNYKNCENQQLPLKTIFQKFQNCKTLTKYNQLITIYNNKILVCCGEVGYLNINKEIESDDLLDLNTLQNEQQIIDFCNQPHKICNYCISNDKAESFILWQKKNKITEKHQENDLAIIFSQFYQDYKKMVLDCSEHLNCLNDKFFYNNFLDEVNPGELEYLNIKYFSGIADVCVFYDNLFNKNLYEKLMQKLSIIKNIEKYNFYFIGINNTEEHNYEIFNLYNKCFNSKIKITFLQENNLIKGYKEFLKYSYLNKKILLDINNFLQSDTNYFK